MIAPSTAPATRRSHIRRLGRLGRAVAQHDVAQLVRHHAGDFAFGLRRLDHAAVDVHRAARQRERVDLAHVDGLERVAELGMPQLGRNRLDQPPADVLDVRRHLVVAHDRQLLFGLAAAFARAPRPAPACTCCGGVRGSARRGRGRDQGREQGKPLMRSGLCKKRSASRHTADLLDQRI